MTAFDIGMMTAAAFAGVGLGVFYFAGLWLTVRALPESKSPAALMISSFIGRTAAVLAGMYLLMDGSWERPALAVLGFVAGRKLVISRTGQERKSAGEAG